MSSREKDTIKNVWNDIINDTEKEFDKCIYDKMISIITKDLEIHTQGEHMQPTKVQTITPKPYLAITFGCSNRAFFEVRNDLCELCSTIGIEFSDGYFTEESDYEGDLDRIIIYNSERSAKLIDAVMELYDIPRYKLPDDLNIHLSIF